ncbi:hypothetical protein [Streptomyces sp. NPDC005374]
MATVLFYGVLDQSPFETPPDPVTLRPGERLDALDDAQPVQQ